MPESLPPGVPLFDADGALSQEYLLHRGFCCRNGCRNCPYGYCREAPEDAEAEGPESGQGTPRPV